MKSNRLGLTELTCLVIGSIIAGGIFNLMHDVATGAGAGAVSISWLITGIGMGSLALCFQNLVMKRPDLNAGIYSYAEAGFGKYMGFNAAWGYWLSAWLGNVGYITLCMSALGYFLPIFGDGQNVPSIILGSVMLWGCHFMALHGIKSASFVNIMVTIAKIIPIILFLIIVFLSFKLHIFEHDFWYTPSGQFQFGDVMHQVKSTMLVMVWTFTGIEGAVIFSGKARHRKDVGRATILGISSMILLYLLMTLLSFGVMSRLQLSHLRQPAMASILKRLVGPWGAVIINLGIVIALVSALLDWTMFAGHVPYMAAKHGTFPKLFSKTNQHHSPVNSLIVTDICVEIFMFSFLITPRAYNFMYSIASSIVMIPYTFSAVYQLKYSVTSDHTAHRVRNIIIGTVASAYSLWIIYATGLNYWLLASWLFALGIPCYIWLQKHDNHR
ncbi:MAG: amino acid permease [Acetilactobacillus jinshanensis]